MSDKIIRLVLLIVLAGLSSTPAEEHRATHLGNPDTRFAPPLTSPEHLRARFSDERLKPDIASILNQWGWRGNLEDLHRGARTGEVTEVTIPVGASMPFMSSRHGGKPICLRNVIWEGEEPISAYAFTFMSCGRRYRCVTPKPCSNFFLEDLGAPVLTLACDTPVEALVGRPIKLCLNLTNTGDAVEPRAIVTLPLPEGATYLSPSNGPVSLPTLLTWTLSNLAPQTGYQLCGAFTMPRAGSLSFAATVHGGQSPPVQSSCATRVAGIPAILLEVIDLDDPVEVDEEVIYEIKVTNQGSASGTNIRLTCTLPPSQEFIAGTGTTPLGANADRIIMEPVPELAPKAVASWQVRVKALVAADARFAVQLRSDQFAEPIRETEATQQY